MSSEIFATIELAGVTPEHVWPLLTEDGNLTQWFCEAAQVDLPAGDYRFWGRFTPDTPSVTAHQTRLDGWTEPDAAGAGGWLSFGWRLRGQDTHVEIKLALRAGGGTELTVHHSGLGERMNSKGAVHDFWYSVLANLKLYALTGRAQQFVEYGPMAGTSLRVEVDIAAEPAAIFRYLIEPEFMARIWQDDKVKVEPQVGGVYDYGWEAGGPRRILAIDPPHLLSFSWLYPPETIESTVTWRLVDRGEGVTRLSLEHRGFVAGSDHEEYRAGWFSFLALIKGMVELGERWSRIELTGSAHGAA